MTTSTGFADGAPEPLPPTSGAVDHAPSLLPSHESLLARFREGDRLALARAISIVENERDGFQGLLHALLVEGVRGGARLGLTGPPGAGKSSLVAALTRAAIEGGEEVGVVAVDPTSPFSGGALLGDRIRMNDLATDPRVFIRSMASRGSLGGLATTSKEVLDVMEAFGFPRLLVETVGVGQTELEIAGAADTVVVVLVPESGDGIQAMKAGLMEIADIFVVNKADRPGADRLVKEIRTALHLREGRTSANVPAHHGVDHARLGKKGEPRGAEEEAHPPEEVWTPPVLLTMAHAGEGVDELLRKVADHRTFLERTGALELRRRERALIRVRDVLERELRRRARRTLAGESTDGETVSRILSGEASPYSVAGEFLKGMGIRE